MRTSPDMGLLDELATGVAWLDAAARVTHANPAFSEHTGFGATRLLGRTLAVLAPDGLRLHARALRARSDATTLAFDDATVCAAPGREARLDFTFTPAGDGVIVEAHAAGTGTHPTRVSESLRGFAHEVRNPLAAISGAAQLLEQPANDARRRELAGLIRLESARLAALSERLLGTRSDVAMRAVNVHAVLERAAGLLAAECPGIRSVRDYDPSLPAWHGDPDRLLQALVNLVRNARDAGATRIVLRSRAEPGWRDARGRHVPALRIEIEDDGHGVPDALAATLFEPMVSGRPDGTGLGLALAREIAREHGGELTWRRGEPGACFIVLLPRHPRAVEGVA